MNYFSTSKLSATGGWSDQLFFNFKIIDNSWRSERSIIFATSKYRSDGLFCNFKLSTVDDWSDQLFLQLQSINNSGWLDQWIIFTTSNYQLLEMIGAMNYFYNFKSL